MRQVRHAASPVLRGSKLWINHDKWQRDSQKMSPGYYE